MNIFATSPSPEESAAYLDDKRVIKMILETAQMLSTVRGGPYKPTHQHHPCVKWLRSSDVNYSWLYRHFVALCAEYTKRYGKVHKCAQYQSLFFPTTPTNDMPKTFADCSNIEVDTDIHIRYQLCLARKWAADKRKPTRFGVSL